MSRLFAKYLMETNRIEPDLFALALTEADFVGAGRFLKSRDAYEFKVPDFYMYLRTGAIETVVVRIETLDLVRMINVDSFSDDEKNELYYHKLLSGLESDNGSVDDDVLWGISILQYFYHISHQTLVELRRGAHCRRLGRIESGWIKLKRWVLHSSGGRKTGSLGAITEVDRMNVENADVIIQKCVERDWYDEFMDLHRILCRLGKCHLTVSGIKWKFYILRYKWKLNAGVCSPDKEYEADLQEKNKKYKIFDLLEF